MVWAARRTIRGFCCCSEKQLSWAIVLRSGFMESVPLKKVTRSDTFGGEELLQMGTMLRRMDS